MHIMVELPVKWSPPKLCCYRSHWSWGLQSLPSFLPSYSFSLNGQAAMTSQACVWVPWSELRMRSSGHITAERQGQAFMTEMTTRVCPVIKTYLSGFFCIFDFNTNFSTSELEGVVASVRT